MAFKIPKFIKSIFDKKPIERERINRLATLAKEENQIVEEKALEDNPYIDLYDRLEKEEAKYEEQAAKNAEAKQAKEAEQNNPYIAFYNRQADEDKLSEYHFGGNPVPTHDNGDVTEEKIASDTQPTKSSNERISEQEKEKAEQEEADRINDFIKRQEENSSSSSSTSPESTGNSAEGTSTLEPDAPSSGSTTTSTEKSDNKKTGTTKFVSSDDPRIGTVDSDGNFYMPDDISGGGISAGAKQHAYRKAYDKAAGSQKWRDEQIEKIKSAEQPQNMTDEEWQKVQQKQIDAINKQADKMRNDWSTMQKDSTKINPGLSDYVLGNPHTTAGVLGGSTLGYLALQLSDSRGQMTNQQLYGQDDLT